MTHSSIREIPFSAPTSLEVDALARSARYLNRAANELKSRSLGTCAGLEFNVMDDLPSLLASAGSLCAAIVDTKGHLSSS